MSPSLTVFSHQALLRTCGLLGVAAVMGGCQTIAPAYSPPEPDSVGQQIDAALQRVDRLAPFTRGPDHVAPDPRLEDTITTTFHGDAAVLLRRLAQARDKTLIVLGPKPHLPLLVQISVVDVPYEDFLRDIGYQFGQRADLVLADRHIEIRYRGTR